MVYVISKNGNPIMPTKDYRKVRLLLKSKEAKVIRRTPFTIQLLTTSHCYTQDITLGVDAGSKYVGLSATTEKQELLSAELHLRNDVVKLLSDRREFRTSRRNRKTRHRKERFNNRVHSKHKGWLAPSVEVKIWNHIQAIKHIIKLLPISKIIVETAEFDIQKLKGNIDYQHGEMYGEYNVRQYVLHRDNYTCQNCGVNKDVKLHVHHIESRKIGGNAPNNLITLCEHCHKAYHEGKLNLKLRRGKSYRDASFMGIMRKTLIKRLINMFPNIEVRETLGYITKYYREKYNIKKTHISDAFIISKNFNAKRLGENLLIVPKRRHNRKLHKSKIYKGGYRKSNQTPKYMFGYQLFDRVIYNGQEGFIFGRRSSGSFDVRKLNEEVISHCISYKKLKLVEYRKSLLIEREVCGASSNG